MSIVTGTGGDTYQFNIQLDKQVQKSQRLGKVCSQSRTVTTKGIGISFAIEFRRLPASICTSLKR